MQNSHSSFEDFEHQLLTSQHRWAEHRTVLEEQEAKDVELYIDEVLLPFFDDNLATMAQIQALQPTPLELKKYFTLKGRAHAHMGEIAEAVGEVTTAAVHFSQAAEYLSEPIDQLRASLCALQTHLEILMDEDSEDPTEALRHLERSLDILEMSDSKETDGLYALLLTELHSMSLFFCEVISHHSDIMDLLVLSEDTYLPSSPLEEVLGTVLREKELPESLAYFFEALLAAMQGNTDMYHSMLCKTEQALPKSCGVETSATLEKLMRAW